MSIGPEMSVNRQTLQKIFKDFKATRIGSYIKNHWTDYADKKFLQNLDILEEINIGNYQQWLNWNYEMLAVNSTDDPIFNFVENLRKYCNASIPKLFLLSFAEKGIVVPKQTDQRQETKFKEFSFFSDGEKLRYERELVEGRFGKKIILERSYSNGQLVQVTSVYFNDTELILKIDDTERLDYKQWPTSTWLAGEKSSGDDLLGIFKRNEPLNIYFPKRRFMRNLYTGEMSRPAI